MFYMICDVAVHLNLFWCNINDFIFRLWPKKQSPQHGETAPTRKKELQLFLCFEYDYTVAKEKVLVSKTWMEILYTKTYWYGTRVIRITGFCCVYTVYKAKMVDACLTSMGCEFFLNVFSWVIVAIWYKKIIINRWIIH